MALNKNVFRIQFGRGLDTKSTDIVLEPGSLENLENAIKMAYEEMTTPTDVDQTYAGSGEPVSKVPQVMQDKAVEFLISVVKDVASGEMLDSPRTLNEDGHSDVPSAVRAMKTIIEDAGQMLQALEQTGEGSLPTWWTNKMAVSASMMNKMRDYLLYPKTMEENKGKDGNEFQQECSSIQEEIWCEVERGHVCNCH